MNSLSDSGSILDKIQQLWHSTTATTITGCHRKRIHAQFTPNSVLIVVHPSIYFPLLLRVGLQWQQAVHDFPAPQPRLVLFDGERFYSELLPDVTASHSVTVDTELKNNNKNVPCRLHFELQKQ